MKLSDVKRNIEATEGGEWIGAKYGTAIPGMGDLCLKTRGAGNTQWRALEERLVSELPAVKRIAGLSNDDRATIITKCLVETALLDWDCVDGETGPIPYSKEQAESLLNDPTMADFRGACLYAANIVGTAAVEALKADAKN